MSPKKHVVVEIIVLNVQAHFLKKQRQVFFWFKVRKAISKVSKSAIKLKKQEKNVLWTLKRDIRILLADKEQTTVILDRKSEKTSVI